MSARVPHRRVDVDLYDILSDSPVKGFDWASIARLANWVKGQGFAPVPTYSPNVSLSNGVTHTFRFQTNLRAQPTKRRWFLGGPSSAFISDVDVTPPSGTTSEVRLPLRAEEGVAWADEIRSSRSEGETSFDFKVKPKTTSFTIESLSAVDFPRDILGTGSTDKGIEIEALRPRQLYQERALSKLIETVRQFQTGPDGIGMRNHIQWAVPFETDGTQTTSFAVSTTSNSFQDVFPLNIPVLGRKQGRNDTTQTLEWGAQVWIDDNNHNVEVRARSASNGDTVKFATSSTSATIITRSDLTVQAEDLSKSDGLQGGTWDDVNVEIRSDDPDNIATAFLTGFYVYEL